MSEHSEKINFQITLRKKILPILAMACGLLSALSFFSYQFLEGFNQLFRISMDRSVAPVLLLFICFIISSFLYLQSGGKENTTKLNADTLHIEEILKELVIQKEWTSKQVTSLNDKINSFESDKGLSADEKKTIISNAVAKVSEDAIKTIFKNEATELQIDIQRKLSFERLTDSSKHIIMRLRREITDLRLRSNINLLIGMSITAGGLYLLWDTISMVDASQLLKQLASEGNESNAKFIKNLTLPIIPRFSLVIFIEIFAYFFLRLYKNGLSEIKYFQNELTNLESKLVAVEFSYITNNEEGLKASIEALSKTERNFVLEKGQTTVELERAKSDSELTKNLVKTIPRIMGKGKSK